MTHRGKTGQAGLNRQGGNPLWLMRTVLLLQGACGLRAGRYRKRQRCLSFLLSSSFLFFPSLHTERKRLMRAQVELVEFEESSV